MDRFSIAAQQFLGSYSKRKTDKYSSDARLRFKHSKKPSESSVKWEKKFSRWKLRPGWTHERSCIFFLDFFSRAIVFVEATTSFPVAVEIGRDYRRQTSGCNIFLSLFFLSLLRFERFNFITTDVCWKTNFPAVKLFSTCGDRLFPHSARASRIKSDSLRLFSEYLMIPIVEVILLRKVLYCNCDSET